jgi:steroid delta-isomerase-like uncharacterized protein
MANEMTIVLIARYYEAFTSREAERMLAWLSEDVAHDSNQGDRQVGKAAFRTFLAHMERCNDEHLTGMRIMASPDGTRAAAEFVVHGKYLITDADLPEASGQTYVLPAGAFFEVGEGLIRRVTMYYNLADWTRQVGDEHRRSRSHREEIAARIDDLAGPRMTVSPSCPIPTTAIPNARRTTGRIRCGANAVLVAAFDGPRVVGAATASPMAAQKAQFRAPLEAQGLATADMFYFSVLLANYKLPCMCIRGCARKCISTLFTAGSAGSALRSTWSKRTWRQSSRFARHDSVLTLRVDCRVGLTALRAASLRGSR